LSDKLPYIPEDRHSQLKQLIAKGKEQGFLTYTEVNDHLPDGIVEPEQIEDIVRMINDMGITVHETAPAEIDALSNDSAVADDEAAEAAAAALASVDSEFGRTTDPVRMYMREMGTVELLTREGELRIAKRIEDGIQTPQNKGAPAANGANGKDAKDAKDEEEEEEEDAYTGPDPIEAQERMTAIRALHEQVLASIEEHGSQHDATMKLRKELASQFMELKLAPKMFEALIENLRGTVERVRSLERQIMTYCIRQAGMPRKEFIGSFPENETNLDWINKHIRAKRKHSSQLSKLKDDIIRAHR
jgi:RNA polymerase primary sigma factor